MQSTSLLLAFALLEPLAWKAHLLVRQPEWKVRWGYSVPQGRTVSRERSGQREPPVPRMQALPVASEQLVLGAHSVRRAQVCPY